MTPASFKSEKQKGILWLMFYCFYSKVQRTASGQQTALLSNSLKPAFPHAGRCKVYAASVATVKLPNNIHQELYVVFRPREYSQAHGIHILTVIWKRNIVCSTSITMGRRQMFCICLRCQNNDTLDNNNKCFVSKRFKMCCRILNLTFKVLCLPKASRCFQSRWENHHNSLHRRRLLDPSQMLR